MAVHPIHHDALRRAEVRYWSAVLLVSAGAAMMLAILAAMVAVLWGRA